MKSIDILVVVDTLGATASGNLQSNVYLIDTNKYLGSWNEGQCELHTICYDNQIIKWRVTPVSPENDVDIVGFTGQMIDQKICVPQKQGITQDIYWEGIVETRGDVGRYQYSMVLTIDGKRMTFDPFLEVQK